MKKKLVKLLFCVTVAAVFTTGCSFRNEMVVDGTGAESAELVTESSNNQTESSVVTQEPVKKSEEVKQENTTETEKPDKTAAPAVKPEETLQPTATPTEAPTDAPKYTVTSVNATMYAKQTVNVRKGPSTDYERVGSLSQGQEVEVTGKASTGWYEISYDGVNAYVSGSYLTDTKPIASISGPLDKTANSGGSTSNIDPNDPSLAFLIYSEAEMDEAYNRGDLATYQAMLYANFDAYCALLGVDPGYATTTPGEGGSSSGSTELVVNTTVDFVNYLNEQREAQEIHTLSWNGDLESVALERASEIVDDFSHNKARGCDAEIILKISEGGVENWYNGFYGSVRHRNIMLGLYDEVAAAYAEIGGMYYVVVLFYI